MNLQVQALRQEMDILVATPGRLLHHLQQKRVNLSRVEILVLDEADRMLDMGFIRDICRLLALLPPIRQNPLFSATFTEAIRRLAVGLLHAPTLVEVARRDAGTEQITQRVYPVSAEHKGALLVHSATSGHWRHVLVFTRTKHGANRLAHQLGRDGIQAEAIHGDKHQPQRTRVLRRFKDGQIPILVATDIATRGLDIEAWDHGVNYNLPQAAEEYVHRIGRNSRAGASDEAVSLMAPSERPLLGAIEKLPNRRLERHQVPSFSARQAFGAVCPFPTSQPPGPRHAVAWHETAPISLTTVKGRAFPMTTRVPALVPLQRCALEGTAAEDAAPAQPLPRSMLRAEARPDRSPSPLKTREEFEMHIVVGDLPPQATATELGELSRPSVTCDPSKSCGSRSPAPLAVSASSKCPVNNTPSRQDGA